MKGPSQQEFVIVIVNVLSFFSYSGIGISYWIGATDIVEEGTYVWTDGSEVPMGAPFWGSVSIYLSQKTPQN